MKQKTVAVIAYCARNVGDDLFMTLVADRYPESEFLFFAPNLDALGAVRDRPNVGTINDRSFRRTHFDLLLVLGGSMFQEERGWLKRWARFLLRFLWATLRRCPIAIVGISFGPARTEAFILAHRILFRMARWISVRDSSSAETFHGLQRLHQFPDLVFAHPMVAGGLPAVRRPRVGMSIMDFGPRRFHPHYLTHCAALIERITETTPVLLMSFQEYGEINDGAAVSQVVSLLSARARVSVAVEHYDGSDLSSFLDTFKQCSAMIATRFHATVLAVAFGMPCVAISYHPKVADTIEALRLPVAVFAPDQLERSHVAILKTLLRPQLEGERESGSDYRTAAMNHLKYLDSLFLVANP